MDDPELAQEVQRLLREGFPELPEPVVKPVLTVVSGLPGSGKSYFSQKLVERFPCVIVESDALRKMLFPIPSYTPQESERLFKTCHSLIEKLLKKGICVLLDATNLIEHHRERLYNIAERLGAKLILVRVEAPAEVIRQRLQGRTEDKSNADWAVYQRMKPKMQKIRRNHFAVDTSRDIAPVIDKIIREARR